MAEFLNIRRAGGPPLEAPGRALQRLPLQLDSVLHGDQAQWCGDFTATSLGFGHVKLLRREPAPGTFALRGDTLHVVLVCDGFHRGTLSDQGLRVVMVAGPGGLQGMPAAEVRDDMLGHVELDVVTRPTYAWKHPVTSGRAPELQVAVAHLLTSELCEVAAGRDRLELYFFIRSGRGLTYINLDGVPGHNFAVDSTHYAPRAS